MFPLKKKIYNMTRRHEEKYEVQYANTDRLKNHLHAKPPKLTKKLRKSQNCRNRSKKYFVKVNFCAHSVVLAL